MSEAERVTQQLRDEILDGVRLREALKALVSEGLVTLRPRSWAVVRTFTDSDIAAA